MLLSWSNPMIFQELPENLIFYQEKSSVLADVNQYVSVRSRLWKGYASLASCDDVLPWVDKIVTIQECGFHATELDVGLYKKPFWISLPVSKWYQDSIFQHEAPGTDWCTQHHDIANLTIWEKPSMPHWASVIERLSKYGLLNTKQTVSWKASKNAIVIASNIVTEIKNYTIFNYEGCVLWLLEIEPINQRDTQQTIAAELLNLQLRSYLGGGSLDCTCSNQEEAMITLNVPRADTTIKPSEREQQVSIKVKGYVLDECIRLILKAWRALMPPLTRFLDSKSTQEDFSRHIEELFDGDSQITSTVTLQTFRKDATYIYELLEDNVKRWGIDL